MTDRTTPAAARTLTLSLALLLAACGDDGAAPGRSGGNARGGDDGLPAPEGRPGRGVTGMPDTPGPGQVGPPVPVEGEPAPDRVMLDEFGNPLPADPGAPGDPALPADGEMPTATEGADATVDAPLDAGNGEPDAADAVAAVRDYYAAINARAYGRAYAQWADGGRASGQSPQQFADGFANTEGVSVEILAPGRIEGAAGARLVEVPVAFTARQADGSERRFVGAYTLRRSVVDGATPAQRAWRIASADLREVQP